MRGTQEKWCLLISSKPIIPEHIDEEDDYTLDSDKLPPGIQPDVMYFFNSKNDDSTFEETIPAKDILQLTVPKFNHNDPVYKFHLDLGDRVAILAGEDIPTTLKWITALQCSKATAKE